jgi:4-carboxymuconolactone decarboxylase
VILRIGWLCEAEYEWAQHVRIGKQAGLTDDEVHRIKVGPTAKGWSERDVLLLRATDELHKDGCISDATWRGLSKYYNVQQLIDIVFAVGQYSLVSMALNTLGVQLDAGLTRTFENT